jgi:hypothetical protein
MLKVRRISAGLFPEVLPQTIVSSKRFVDLWRVLTFKQLGDCLARKVNKRFDFKVICSLQTRHPIRSRISQTTLSSQNLKASD